jgi:hypothetical protein
MQQDSYEDVHQEGWMKVYMRLAELLENNPGHRGWFSNSRFVDPELEKISPYLSYLRIVPQDNGGGIWVIIPQG